VDCVFSKPFWESDLNLLMRYIEDRGCESNAKNRKLLRALVESRMRGHDT
jgi:hypothetical protein